MPDQPAGRRIPADYLDRFLPTLEDLFAAEPGQTPQAPPAAPSRNRRRKVHFYIDPEDYAVLERLVSQLTEMQGPLSDPKGLYSKILRASVKIGLKEIVSHVGRGGQG
ncbi:MAG: hypothetical protein RMJ28_07075 [Nitrososphaerota archaeon]|nr:hypothetical protein [Candidatus Calditenuaceae archaeon]MDW8073976.1 hypothetical protein [Nitrososphaerota archaeon]